MIVLRKSIASRRLCFVRSFSTQNPTTLQELQSKIDMHDLKQFNPKLAAQIEQDPSVLLKLQDLVQNHE